MEYSASLDLKSRIITAFVTVLFAGMTIFHVIVLQRSGINAAGAAIIVGANLLIIAIFVYCYLYRVTQYVVERDRLIIRRPINDKVIELRNIREVIVPTPESMRWTLRTFGNGGVFGYFGKFANTTYGTMTWYATRTSNYVLLVTDDHGKVVITPDDMEIVRKLKLTAI